jgi:hypothetical protein
MSVNKYKPYVFVLPEDRANEQLANGFLLDQSLTPRSIQVLEVAGGWLKVLECFKSDHVHEMDRDPRRFMVLLIDFDGQQDKLGRARADIPAHLTDRVFVLGVWTEPEDLKRADLGTYETIGSAMAQDCREGTDTIWSHALLRHNASEIDRLREHVRPILFPSV